HHTRAPSDASSLSLHAALPIFRKAPLAIAGGPRLGSDEVPGEEPLPPLRDCQRSGDGPQTVSPQRTGRGPSAERDIPAGETGARSEEHTSELQSRGHLVCRLLI